MPRLRIVSINITHSQEDKIPRCSTDREWAQAISCCLSHNEPLYVAPCGHEDYLRQYFINQTLTADGYIIPGDYETETPEHGKVKYSIWTERSDYCETLFRKAIADKLLGMTNELLEAYGNGLPSLLMLASSMGEEFNQGSHGIQGARGVQKEV